MTDLLLEALDHHRRLVRQHPATFRWVLADAPAARERVLVANTTGGRRLVRWTRWHRDDDQRLCVTNLVALVDSDGVILDRGHG